MELQLDGPEFVPRLQTKRQLSSAHSSLPAPSPYIFKLKEPGVRPTALSAGISASTRPSAAVENIQLQISPLLGEPNCDHAQAHEILWEHFGFYPYDPGLDLETAAYKLQRSPSPAPPIHTGSRDTPFPLHHRRSHTSPSSPSADAYSSLPNTMTKKRRSLTAILVPSFLPQAAASTSALSPLPPSATRARSNSSVTTTTSTDFTAIESSADWISFYSGASSPLTSVGPVTPSRNSPPPDLLDEDPFANLSPSPSVRASHASSPNRRVHELHEGPSRRALLRYALPTRVPRLRRGPLCPL
ncbi:hypothetical protein BD309DRAFT_357190 [Dichomitus squalens]|nr:hypothetical protein BD309DRAFT_357190 [Dichomitus squalens]